MRRADSALLFRFLLFKFLLFKFAARSGLVEADAARGDFGLEIIFAEDGRTSQTAQHGDLADVIEGVGDRALEEAFGGTV